jgi:hypothetical protein
MKPSNITSALAALLKRPFQKLLLRALRDVYRRLDRMDSRLDTVETRLDRVESRALSTRAYALEEIADYLKLACIKGDYYEFGVAQGHVFSFAARLFGLHFPTMRFLAFDSFEGLPQPTGLDAADNYSGGFAAGEFSCTEPQFISNLSGNNVDLSRTRTFPGWFDATLNSGDPAIVELGPAAVAWIDCDYYESTVPVLKFLTGRLAVGSVIVFDDWGCFRNLPEKGEQRACKEWLEQHPEIRLHELMSFGWNGKVFTVGAC